VRLAQQHSHHLITAARPASIRTLTVDGATGVLACSVGRRQKPADGVREERTCSIRGGRSGHICGIRCGRNGEYCWGSRRQRRWTRHSAGAKHVIVVVLGVAVLVISAVIAVPIVCITVSPPRFIPIDTIMTHIVEREQSTRRGAVHGICHRISA